MLTSAFVEHIVLLVSRGEAYEHHLTRLPSNRGDDRQLMNGGYGAQKQ